MYWVLFALAVGLGRVSGAHWSHSAELDPNYAVFWTPGDKDITFEVQVRTLGYIGFGFSMDGKMPGADMVIGWIRDGHVIFQDRHSWEHREPEVDSSQDYEMLHGYSNGTHTVIRFRRRYDTCDSNDYRITNDTMRVLFSYHSTRSEFAGLLPYHGPHHRGAQSLYLFDRLNLDEIITERTLTWDLKISIGSITVIEDNLNWCKMFRIPSMRRKHHMVRFEGMVSPNLRRYVSYMVVYECHGNDVGEFETHVRGKGHVCYQAPMLPILSNYCNNLVIAWGTGSEGFNFPEEAGYPLDPVNGPKYFLLETHYSKSPQDVDVSDSSGIRVHYTASLRENDAGVLSVGMDPNWRHIIPPGQPHVVSEGHCISACTKHTLPHTGINMFAVALHTHQIGRKFRLRHLRQKDEFHPISQDYNYDYKYQEFRRLQKQVTVYPGDHLIAECVYNSVGRSTITLGGLTPREEMCLVFVYHYPRIPLSICHSLPSLPTVLHSLGIQELWQGSSPIMIKSPPELSDMTLESRLLSYDWENNFRSFQEATRKGSFKALCWVRKPTFLPGTEGLEEFYPNITHPYRHPGSCLSRWMNPRRRKKPGQEDDDEDLDDKEQYDSIGSHESSRLNNAECVLASPLVLFIIVMFIK